MLNQTLPDQARRDDSIRLVKRLRLVSRRNLPTSQKRLTKKDFDNMQDAFLDCYKIYMAMRERVPIPGLLDENGAVIDSLEQSEQRLRPHVSSQDRRMVKLVKAWLHLLQETRWLIMINDGLMDRQRSSGKIYKTASECMTALEHA